MRLRILQLLEEGPLCVCHLQEILDEGQVRTSKQLAYLRQYGLVTATRCGAWMVYALSETASPLLFENLAWLRSAAGEESVFATDQKKRAAVVARIASEGTEDCPANVVEEICGCAPSDCCADRTALVLAGKGLA